MCDPVIYREVVASFPAAIQWDMRKLSPESKPPPDTTDLFRLRGVGSRFDRQDLLVSSGLVPKREPHQPRLQLVIVPYQREVANEIGEDDRFDLLGREISIPLNSPQQPRDRRDVDRLEAALKASAKLHYVLFSDGMQQVVFETPVRLPTSKQWKPESAGNGKKSRKLKGNKRAKYDEHIAVISLMPNRASDELGTGRLLMCPHYPKLTTSVARFQRTMPLDYETLSSMKVGDILPEPSVLTRARDPKFAGFQADEAGNNALTDFNQISIPLFWPEGRWESAACADIQSLRSWTERSWDAFIYFLEGKRVDSIDELVQEGTVDVERISSKTPKRGSAADRERRGQCYYNSDAKIARVVGPYLIFEVRVGERVVYVLDSPFYGIALRLYGELETACSYAQGGESRAELEQRVDGGMLAPKISHDADGRWETTLQSRLENLVEVGS